MKCSLSAVVLAAVLSVSTAASAAQPALPPLPAPPPPGAPVSSALFEAMLAIERAAATNPAAAQRAAFSYNAAIQQYHAGEYERARASALTAIGQSAVPVAPAAGSAIISRTLRVPAYYMIPDELSANQTNAERYVMLAHRAMGRSCGPVNGSAPSAVVAEYRGAIAALGAKQYRMAMADSRNIVDDCAAATQRGKTAQR